ncbi:MAG: class I SAM-dependent methyltransferase [Pseudomonadota bacterium]
MSFSADWLALREPADRRARDAGLIGRLASWGRGRAPLIVDLGAGTGSTYRVLSPHLPGARWRLVDRDAALLAHVGGDAAVETVVADLAGDLEPLLRGADIVTGSALIDLAARDWLSALCQAAPPSAAIYMALSYDGEETWSPTPPDEAEALAAFHAHQRGDKGLGGPALGPDAASAFAEILRASGREVFTGPSPWRLGADDAALISALADGAHGAVEEIGALDAARRQTWLAARRRATDVEIGHVDVLGLPAAHRH